MSELLNHRIVLVLEWSPFGGKYTDRKSRENMKQRGETYCETHWGGDAHTHPHSYTTCVS